MNPPQAKLPRAGKLPAPEPDKHIGKASTADFARTEAIAHRHGLTYLSISGIVKLSRLIKDIEAQRDKGNDITTVSELKRHP